MALPGKNVTSWISVRPQGYVKASSGAALLTQAGVSIKAQTGIALKLNSNVVTPEPTTVWTESVAN